MTQHINSILFSNAHTIELWSYLCHCIQMSYYQLRLFLMQLGTSNCKYLEFSQKCTINQGIRMKYFIKKIPPGDINEVIKIGERNKPTKS